MSKEACYSEDTIRRGEDLGSLSFAGCGFLGIYHVGVASCFKEYAPHLYSERVSGASAGALVACALVTGACLGECTTFTLKLAIQARSRALGPFSPSFRLVENIRKALSTFLPENAHEIASGRLFISLTRVRDQKNVLISQFKDRDDLLDALTCSSFVPLYSGIIPPSYRGVRYIDGAFSDNVPVWNKGTITVSPFAGESDICPDDQSCNLHHMHLAGTSVQFTAWNLYRISIAFFPPSPEILSNICRQGFDDALLYLKKNRLISCTQHLSIKSDIISSSPLEFDLFEEDATAEEETKTSADYSITINPETSGEEDGEWSCCDECEERERIALHDSPPILVQTALQAACDEANRGFMAKLHKSRVYRVLSLLATPYVLPFEVAYQLVRKLYDWGPYMPEDMQWFIRGLYKLSLGFLSSCESAIKGESGLQLNHLAVTMGVYFGMQVSHTHHRRTSVHRKRSTSRRLSVTRGHPEVHPPLPEEREPQDRSALSSSDNNLSDNVSEQSLSVNFGININYVQSPVQCARSARVHIAEQEHSHHRRESLPGGASCAGALQQGAVGGESPASLAPSKGFVPCDDESYDSFDNYVNVAKQMDSILSYYYLEEDDPTKVRVVEIFPVHPTPGTSQDVGAQERSVEM